MFDVIPLARSFLPCKRKDSERANGGRRTKEKKTEAIGTLMFVRCNIEPMVDEIQSRVLKTSSDFSSRARIFDEA